MQILVIRGGNLASLNENFEINLTEEPLRSAGLFAITGETGAGKSTILDAMCLALYGKCPRLTSDGIEDEVPDIEGETITAKDSRSILRRGASEGFAEVDFIAPDGESYRATWGVRRARGRATGRLQNDDRALIRLSDGKVLANQKRLVLEKVTEVAGLTYDEFRRTCLLAQGDFDAFLSAKASERAELLEKVTGTEIYREISRQIYIRHDEARQAMQLLEAERGATSVLSDEDRQALREEADTLGKAIGELVALLTQLDAKIGKHEALRLSRDHVSQAMTRHGAAVKAGEEAAPMRTDLARLEAGLALKPEFARLAGARKIVTDLEAAERGAVKDLEEVEGVVARAAEAHGKAAEAHDQAEKVFKEFGPIWTEATRLDGLILSAKDEVGTARKASAEALGAKETRESELKKIEDELTRQTAARDQALEQMKTRPQAQRLAERWDDVSASLGERKTRRGEISAAEKDARDLRQGIVSVRSFIEGLGKEDAADRARIAELEAAIVAARTRLAEIAENDPQARMERLRTGEQGLRDMQTAAKAHDQAKAQLEKAEETIREQSALRAEKLEELKKAEEAIREGESQIKVLQAPVDRAEAAASERAAELRRHLEDGQECPVCGSREHPIHADEALAQIAAQMRHDLNNAVAQVQCGRSVADKLGRRIDAASLAISGAEEAAEGARAVMVSTTTEFGSAREVVRGSGIDQLPTAPAGAVPLLGGLLRRIDVRRGEIQAIQKEQAELTKSVEDGREATAALQAKIAGRVELRERKTAQISEAETKAGLCDAKAGAAADRIATIDASLRPMLEVAAVDPATLESAPEAVATKLEATATWWTQAVTARDAAEQALKDLSPKVATAKSELSGAATRVEETKALLSRRADALGTLEAERGAMLGGEATEPHRSRHNKMRLDADKLKGEMSQALADAKSRKSVIEERLRSARDGLVPAREELGIAGADLDAKLAETDLTMEVLPGLIQRGAPEAGRLRAVLKAIDEELTGAASTLKARQDDLKALEAKGVPEEDEASLLEAKAIKAADRDVKQERTGGIAAQLSADDAVREALKGLETRIREAKEVCDTWAAVNEAVGSRDGGKFSQIAQSVTLAMLVERANQHLRDLKPRYQLIQSGDDLALHIVDRDMGDEVRSTRSLSGGERFLVSLALALALSHMGRGGGLAGTLFIDEGFGSLDAETLDIAVDALEALQAQGRTIGVISHVEAMKERILVQVQVMRRGSGASSVELVQAA